MSYDLTFWRQSGSTQQSADTIVAELCNQKTVADIDVLPTEEIIARLSKRFPLTMDGGLTFWDGEAAGSFEIYIIRHSTFIFAAVNFSPSILTT